MTMKERIQHVQERIAQAAIRSDRQVQDIQVIAVTKYVSVERAVEAIQLGLTHVGENRWQNAKGKWDYVHDPAHTNEFPPTTWHFIGSLQTNKVKDVVGKFDYIHSLDRLSLAEAIHKQADKLDIDVKCFIQVNVSGEESKQGMAIEDVFTFIDELKSFSRIIPVGLMTMAPLEAEPEQTRFVFRGLRELRDRIQSESNRTSSITHLSMGMSNDFEVAIEEGATFIRLGTSLVGT